MSRVLSLAGFQVTLIGRFWVIPEVYVRDGSSDVLAQAEDYKRMLAES
jgi:hypothetical protein